MDHVTPSPHIQNGHILHLTGTRSWEHRPCCSDEALSGQELTPQPRVRPPGYESCLHLIFLCLGFSTSKMGLPAVTPTSQGFYESQMK